MRMRSDEAMTGGAGRLSDEALMVAIAEGDRGAFATLVSRHRRGGLGLARRVAASPSDAEEATQDAFVSVWREAARFDPGCGRFTTWFYRILVNRALDYARRRPFAPLDEDDIAVDPSPNPLQIVIADRLRRATEETIESLPPRQRAALALSFYQELPSREVAQVMGVSISTVESLLFRSRQTLREKLQAFAKPEWSGTP
jgi:RNA polymerase sigma-70 factor (ECF subfamily)